MSGRLPRPQTGPAREYSALIGGGRWLLIGNLRDSQTFGMCRNRRRRFVSAPQLNNEIGGLDGGGGDKRQVWRGVRCGIKTEPAGPEIP